MRRDLRFCCVSTYVLMVDEFSGGRGHGQLSLTPSTRPCPRGPPRLCPLGLSGKKNHTKAAKVSRDPPGGDQGSIRFSASDSSCLEVEAAALRSAVGSVANRAAVAAWLTCGFVAWTQHLSWGRGEFLVSGRTEKSNSKTGTSRAFTVASVC